MACRRVSADSIRYASITMSCVAAEKPNNTAANAMRTKLSCPVAGLVSPIKTMPSIILLCATSNHARRRPNHAVNTGKGNLSINGAHTNLNEYANAAQLKNVTDLRSTPASPSHNDREEKISNSGIPAENPKNNMVITRGCKKARSDSAQLKRCVGVDSVIVLPLWCYATMIPKIRF